MPILPAPSGGTGLSGGDLPVTDVDDVLAEFADVHRYPTVAPVRDAFVEAFAIGHVLYQDIAERAAAMCDPTRSTGDYLLSIAEERGVLPIPGETEQQLRDRLFRVDDIVTPQAILDAVNEIIAPYTDSRAFLYEPHPDGWFVHSGVANWDSFIGTNPNYPDRYYDAFPDGLPGGAVPADGRGRRFHLRIPKLDVIDTLHAFVIDSDDEIMVVGNGSDTSGAESDGTGASSVFNIVDSKDDVYQAIVAKIYSIKGQGMDWALIVEDY